MNDNCYLFHANSPSFGSERLSFMCRMTGIFLLAVVVGSVLLPLRQAHSDESGEEAKTHDVVLIEIEPETTREIEGISELERRRYFNVCDPGTGFESRVKNDEMYEYLVDELGISFGRRLGVVKYPAKSIPEDPVRPGYPDISRFRREKVDPPSERMARDFGDRLDVAAHGQHNAFPEYMGKFTTDESVRDPKHEEFLPKNIDAAAYLSAAVLKFGFNDFERPSYYEPVNEPHWSFPKTQHLADWHLKTMDLVHRATDSVKVGGPCLPVCYFYRNNYGAFNGLREFIDRTDARMDFYSFHTYDYLRWRDGELRGRVQSGVALEGTLDLVQNYTVNTHGKHVDVVVSEQGGYIGSDPKGEFDGEFVAGQIMAEHHPDADPTSWDYEMKKRSVVCFGHVSSIIANTLAFVEHPHCVQKTVPFLLPNTWSWGPKYYAQLYVPRGYQDQSQWVETDMLAYFKFFRDLQGRRVKAFCADPDLQVRAFVDGKKLFLVVNNQSFSPETVQLDGIDAESVHIRRFGRKRDFTVSYTEDTIALPKRLRVAGREAIMIVAEHDAPIAQTRRVNEIVCYGDKVAQPVDVADFVVVVPQDATIDYAQLRIGLTRSPESDRTPTVRFNGMELEVPLEDCAERFVDREYAMTKLVALDPAMLKSENQISIRFPDGGDGAIGSVVIRAAVNSK
ncbi:MAG: beta-agarase [Rhodopirellula sp. JB053]